MRIIICGSMSAYKEMKMAKSALLKMSHDVEMPNLDHINDELDENGNSTETSEIKVKYDLIRGYFEKIKNSNAVLVVNNNKKGISGYIGGNTFLEIGFGYVLGKKIYILNEYSKELPYYDEIVAMQPIILFGDLNNI